LGGVIIDKGSVLVEDGKISQVSAGDIQVEGATVFIDAHTHVGISEEGFGDYNEWVDPVTPYLRAIDGNPMEQGVKDALEGGITTICAAPGSANVIGGTACVFKPFGKVIDKMVIKDPVALKAATGENPKRVYRDMKKSPVTRMATLMRQALLKAKSYMEKKEKYANEPEKQPDFDLGMEHLCMVLRKEIPIRIAREFDINITIDH